MKRTVVSLLWIALLNIAFTESFAEYSIRFNPTITHQEAYDFGQTCGVAFFAISVALVVYLAATNRLPGARQRTSSENS
jgi:hypothetical protein